MVLNAVRVDTVVIPTASTASNNDERIVEMVRVGYRMWFAF